MPSSFRGWFRARILFLIAALIAIFSHPAFAQSPPPAASASIRPVACDFYLEAMIGIHCARSIDASFELDSQRLSVDGAVARLVVPTPGLHPVFVGSYDYTKTWLDGITSLSITPLDWLKLTVGSEYNDYHLNGQKYVFVPAPCHFRQCGGHFELVPDKASLDNWAWQTLTANIAIVDTGPGDARYVLNGIVGAGFLPEQSNVSGGSEIFAGVEPAARWVLNHSDFSIASRSLIEIAHTTVDQQSVLRFRDRFYLSQDAWGVAIGPAFDSDILLNQSGGIGSHPRQYLAGADFLAQPFRASKVPVLSDVTVQGSALHSIGQAGFVSNGKAQLMDYTLVVSLHFQY